MVKSGQKLFFYVKIELLQSLKFKLLSGLLRGERGTLKLW